MSEWRMPEREPEVEAVSLRRATEEDAETLAVVGAATFLEAFTWMLPGADIVAHCVKNHTAAAYREYLAKADTRIRLAVTGGDAPVGYAMVTAPELPSFDVQPGDVELKRIYLFSRFRSSRTPVVDAAGRVIADMRVGQALMDAAIADARELGGRRLLLGTHEGNERAIAFYRRNGFAEAGTRTFQVGSQCCCDLIFARPIG
ncbi:MAG TPA: GNAT family N-acetyltransferase [Acidobacteriaceae bacterium]|nr:GNAT family N-acetyltransferase [Acidobacteriaceae bacterium]